METDTEASKLGVAYLFCDSCKKRGRLPAEAYKVRRRYRCSRCNGYLRRVGEVTDTRIFAALPPSHAVVYPFHLNTFGGTLSVGEPEEHDSTAESTISDSPDLHILQISERSPTRRRRSRRFVGVGLCVFALCGITLAVLFKASEDARRGRVIKAEQKLANERYYLKELMPKRPTGRQIDAKAVEKRQSELESSGSAEDVLSILSNAIDKSKREEAEEPARAEKDRAEREEALARAMAAGLVTLLFGAGDSEDNSVDDYDSTWELEAARDAEWKRSQDRYSPPLFGSE